MPNSQVPMLDHAVLKWHLLPEDFRDRKRSWLMELWFFASTSPNIRNI